MSVHKNHKGTHRSKERITSKQRGLFGADLARSRAGKKTKTGLSAVALSKKLKKKGK